MPDVSYAVILTRDAARARSALDAIARQTPPAELLLVLNDVDEAMRALAREAAAGGARILHDGADLGIPTAWNLALRDADSPYLCVVHEDSELGPGCAERLLRTLREHPAAGAAGPSVHAPDGSVSQQGALIWSDGATSLLTTLPADVHPVDYAGSSCLVVDREAALGVGGFDERFFPACYVDAALGVELWRAGRSVLCDRRAQSVHRLGAMVDPGRGERRGARMRAYLYARNRARFRATFGDWLAGQAHRADAADARHPQPAELDDALARAREREAALPAQPPASAGGLVIEGDLAARAARLRRELEDDFLAELVAREQALADEATGLHHAYAELHRDHVALRAELDGVHAAYAELWADRRRLLDAAARLELAQGEHG